MESLQELNNWISGDRDFFFLRKPGVAHIDAYILGPETQLGQSTVVICPFESDIPTAFTISHHLKLNADSLSTISIDLKQAALEGEYTSTTQSRYIAQVKTALNAIHDNQFEKVVIAQTQWLPNEDTDAIRSFQQACAMPDSYVYLIRVNGSCWIGASPELFLKGDYKTCETVALAGTRLLAKSHEAWGDKEIQEQLIVGAYIASSFAQLGLDNIKIGEQFTKSVGHIQHICNQVSAELSKNVDWKKLVSKLHPTPALAGYPKVAAIDFIIDTEDFKRKLYGGFLGVMGQQEIDLFVNIRCAELFSNGARLYAGAGINKNSIPESEWHETQSKLAVMRSILA